MPGWSDCPVCHCVTTDPQAHAAKCWPLNSGPTTQEGRWWPDGVNVPEAGVADTLRGRARDALTVIDTDVVPAMDTYLTITSPTAAQVSAQVRTLTVTLRRLALIARGLLRLAGRALDTTD